jgi:hypothetical protein
MCYYEEEKLDNDVGPTVWEVKARELPECKDTAAQWNSIMVRDSMLKCHWELAARRSKTVQTVLFQINVKEVIRELNRGSSGGIWVSTVP